MIKTNKTTTVKNMSGSKYNKDRFEEISFLTAMTLTVLGNYAQTGHFGGPLAYTPYNVALHLSGPESGGLRFDYRRPKHPYADRFLLAGGHNIPTAYALWMIMGEAMSRQYTETNDTRYKVDPTVAMLGIDSLGFRRGSRALKTLLSDFNLHNDPLFKQAKIRGIRSLAGHSETTDLTNDVNGGPSGIGIATSAGKAAFWDFVGAPSSLKIMALEGEFAMTAGHAQELKTQAVAQQVGKRLRILLSFNNAGIDDSLTGGVIPENLSTYDIKNQWLSYGWNVLSIDNGNDFDQIISVLDQMEKSDPLDKRPFIVIGPTTKGWWPTAQKGEIPNYGNQIVGYSSHPYDMKMNSDYFVALAKTFEQRFNVSFLGINEGPVSDERDRLVQFKTNIDVIMSVLNQNGLGKWLADRLVEIGDQVSDKFKIRINADKDPFQDDRLKVQNLPQEAQYITQNTSAESINKKIKIELFKPAFEKAGTRRAISEVIKWMNHITENRFITLAADLSGSINVEGGSLTGHYDPINNPTGTRFKAAIQEAGNTLTAIGLIGQSTSLDPNIHSGVWALSGSYGAFTPLMYLPARVWSQQNQDSPFRVGVLNILAGHSGPETAADARTHFGIFAPQVWKLFPRDQVINLSLWDFNDVAPAYFAAAEIAARDPKVGIIVIEVARPDFPVADRTSFSDSEITAAAKGFYIIRDFAEDKEKEGYVLVQGSSSTFNLVNLIPRLREMDVNVRIISAVSEELFDRQPYEYRESVLPFSARSDMMVVSTGTERFWPIKDPGPLTREYSLTSDWHQRWLSGGSEADVITEAHLDEDSILAAIVKFAEERKDRLNRQLKFHS